MQLTLFVSWVCPVLIVSKCPLNFHQHSLGLSFLTENCVQVIWRLSNHLKFLIRQIDDCIQVAEFMIRETAALDHGELALARNLRAKLGPGKKTEHRLKNIAKEPG